MVAEIALMRLHIRRQFDIVAEYRDGQDKFHEIGSKETAGATRVLLAIVYGSLKPNIQSRASTSVSPVTIEHGECEHTKHVCHSQM